MQTEQKRFSVEFTEQEGAALLQLIDVAVKAQGLTVAAVAAVLGLKIQSAHSAAVGNGVVSNSRAQMDGRATIDQAG